jgi:hypothetical protein
MEESQKCGEGQIQPGFDVYIDWFNPRGNRMAGILLNNLSVRFGIDTPFRKAGFLWHYCTLLPESPSRSSLRAGKSVHCGTPSPSKPTATTMLHLLDPLMKTVLQYNFPGKAVTTYSHPEGMNVTARIIPLAQGPYHQNPSRNTSKIPED